MSAPMYLGLIVKARLLERPNRFLVLCIVDSLGEPWAAEGQSETGEDLALKDHSKKALFEIRGM